jgi:alkaline phosphatase D
MAAIAAGIALGAPGSAVGADGFTGGVTATEITAHSAIIWGRATGDRRVRAEVADGTSFGHLVERRSLQALNRNDETVQVTIRGLRPGHAYHYRFCRRGGSDCGDVGRFETAPLPSDSETVRFAYSGDETGVAAPGERTPLWGNFKAFKSMVAERNDFNVDFGDTIYSDPEVSGVPTAHTVRQKWRMYHKKLAVRSMRRIREATGMYDHWDDHEFINDFSIPENGRRLYNRGRRAFRDYEPVRYSRETGIYRHFRWGRNLELFFLDERSFRSAKASYYGTCDNPETREPDLAPTAPQSTRNLFAALVPSLAQPVSQECKDAINNPHRTFLGKRQLRRFLRDVKHSDARWRVVMNEDPIQQFYGLPYDRWEGYAYERVKLLNALQEANVDHLVFLTTDTHAAFANTVRLRTLSGDVAPSNAPAEPQDTPYHDFIIGPVATKPFWQEIDDTVGGTGRGRALSQAFFKPPPPNGLGMDCAQGGENSYAEVTVKSRKLVVEYKDEDGNTILDADGATPCGPYVFTR